MDAKEGCIPEVCAVISCILSDILDFCFRRELGIFSQLVGRNNGLVSPENFNTAKFCVASASRELEEMRVLTYLLLDVVIYPSHPSKNQNFPPFRAPRLTGRSGQLREMSTKLSTLARIVCGKHK